MSYISSHRFRIQSSECQTATDAGRPFQGRIWMDNQDLQIVKFKGRAVISKEARERYPKMALADDVLEFPRYDFPIRVKITHFDYQRVKGNK